MFNAQTQFYLNTFFAVLVVDKFVPSRALATLPTAYLFFETVNSVGPSRTSELFKLCLNSLVSINFYVQILLDTQIIMLCSAQIHLTLVGLFSTMCPSPVS